MPSRRRLLLAVSGLALIAGAAAPVASAEPIAKCKSEVVDGVEIDTCVRNPNTGIVTDVPGVNTQTEFEFGIGTG
jgi:hypothetical protein